MTFRIGPYFPFGRPLNPNAPLQIAGCSQWFRADLGLYQTTDTSTPVTANGQTVGLWLDQSGNGKNATQSTAANRPTYTATVAAANNMPALAFDNSNDSMLTSLVIQNPFTIFAVWSTADGTVGRRVYEGSSNWMMGCYNGNVLACAAGGFNTGGSITDNVFLIQMVKQTTGGGTMWKNGTQIATVDVGNAPVTGSLSGPSTSQWVNGYIAEIIVYDTQLGTSDRQVIEQYLGTRYNITVP